MEANGLRQSELIAFSATLDGALARAFYEGTLGLEVQTDDDFALVLVANGTMLRIQKVAAFVPDPHTAVGWRVTDLSEMVRQLAERGVAFERYEGMGQDEIGIWRSPSGAKIAWFKDPDGNTLSLTEFP